MPFTSILIYLLFVGLFIGALRKPVFGVLGYLAVYIIYNPYIWWGATFDRFLPRASFTAMLFLTAGAVLHANKLNWTISRRELEMYGSFALCWIVSMLSSVGTNQNTYFYLMKLTKLGVFLFLFIRIVHSLDDYRYVMWMIILSGVFLAYQAHTVTAGYFAEGRLEDIGGIDFRESNGFAAFMAVAMTMLSFQALKFSWPKKLICIPPIAAMLDSIILTRSRSVFIGLVVAFAYVFWKAPSHRRKQIYAFAALGLMLFFMLADVKFLGRIDTIKDPDAHQELNRLDFWKSSVAIFKDHPLGIGVKNFERIVPLYDPRNKGMDAHNTYVLCYSEIGLFGIALFLIILAETYLQLKRIRFLSLNSPFEEEISLHRTCLSAVLLIYLAGYMTTHSILYTEILWILLSMPICLENSTRDLAIAVDQVELAQSQALPQDS